MPWIESYDVMLLFFTTTSILNTNIEGSTVYRAVEVLLYMVTYPSHYNNGSDVVSMHSDWSTIKPNQSVSWQANYVCKQSPGSVCLSAIYQKLNRMCMGYLYTPACMHTSALNQSHIVIIIARSFCKPDFKNSCVMGFKQQTSPSQMSSVHVTITTVQKRVSLELCFPEDTLLFCKL